MDGSQFDTLIRSLAGTRRSLVSGGLALATGWLGASASFAKKKRKHKHKKRTPKAKPNAFGCLEVGDPCTSEEQCCSGICEGKKGKRTCRAHDTGTCDQKAPGICTASNPAALRCNNGENCACLRTTAGSNYCADVGPQDIDVCADCATDADCEDLGFPFGSACVPFSEGLCAGVCATDTACLAPCPTSSEAELPLWSDRDTAPTES